eukprot:2868730-Amphidinium_carterae.1
MEVSEPSRGGWPQVHGSTTKPQIALTTTSDSKLSFAALHSRGCLTDFFLSLGRLLCAAYPMHEFLEPKEFKR